MLQHRCESTDVLVLGSGLAAACVLGAIRRHDPEGRPLAITVATRGERLAGGSSTHNIRGHVGVQAPGFSPLDPGDPVQMALEIHAGGGTLRQPLIDALTRETAPRLRELLHEYDVRLGTRHDDTLAITRAQGASADRMYRLPLEGLRRILTGAFRLPGVRVREHTRAVTLLTDPAGPDGDVPARCTGALLLGDNGTLTAVRAHAVVLCTGGAAGAFWHTLAHPDQVGDGWALAADAGATLANTEFVSFMLAGLINGNERGILPVLRFRRDDLDPKVTDTRSNDLVAAALPDLIDRYKAIRARGDHETFTAASNGCPIDMAIVRANRLHSDPTRPCVRVGFDGGPTYTDVTHYAWATHGGVLIDTDGATGVPGLWAAGEVATGMTGAAPIDGTHIGSAIVFGERAGEAVAAAADAAPDDLPDVESAPELAGLHDDARAPACDGSELTAMRVFASSLLPVVPDQALRGRFAIGRDKWQAPLAERLANPDPASRVRAVDTWFMWRTLEAIVRATVARDTSLGTVCRDDIHRPPDELPDHEVFDWDERQVVTIDDDELRTLEEDDDGD